MPGETPFNEVYLLRTICIAIHITHWKLTEFIVTSMTDDRFDSCINDKCIWQSEASQWNTTLCSICCSCHRAMTLFAARKSALYRGKSAGAKSAHSSPVTYSNLTPAVNIRTGNDRKDKVKTALVKPSLAPLTGASKMKADVTNNE